MSGPSERIVDWLGDIVENAQRIDAHLGERGADALGSSDLILDAVERCLARITEAVARIEQRAPDVLSPIELRPIRALGNVLRHGYDALDPELIKGIVRRDLPILRDAAERAIEKLGPSDA